MDESNGENQVHQQHWILCPICHNKTRLMVREDTEIKNFPLFCPKCKTETLIDVKELKTVVSESHK